MGRAPTAIRDPNVTPSGAWLSACGEDELELGIVVAEPVVRDRDGLLLEERQRLDPARLGDRSAVDRDVGIAVDRDRDLPGA